MTTKRTRRFYPSKLFSPLIEDLNKEKLDAGDDAFVSCYEGETNYRRYVLFLLFTIAVMQNFDRNVPSILFPTLAAELDMTDVDTGLVNGAFFLLVNCALAIRWRDWQIREVGRTF